MMSIKSFANILKKFQLNRLLLDFLLYLSPNVYDSRVLLVSNCDYT